MARHTALHRWDLTPAEAIALQNELRTRLQLHPPAQPIRTIAGADISFDKHSPLVYAGIVVLRLPDLEPIEEAGIEMEVDFPYIPGLLSFREIPALLGAWEQLKTEPDAVMLDGQGIAHPRRLGIGAHFGLLVDRPTLGCAKSVLVGRFDSPPAERGGWSPMQHRKEIIGAALRTKTNVQPVYVSPGHRLDLPGAIALALACDGGYRIPEPTRRAHLLVNALRRAAK